MTRQRRIAMTMIEVLCATALASLLMVAVLGVVGGLARHEKALLNHAAAPAWQSSLERLLLEDFQQGTELKLQRNAIRLSGPLARDPRTGAATWAEAEVAYRIVESKLGRLLLRSVRDPRSVTTAGDGEIVCVGAARLVVARPGAALDPTAHNSPLLTDLRDGAIPERLAIALLDEDNQLVWQTELTL